MCYCVSIERIEGKAGLKINLRVIWIQREIKIIGGRKNRVVTLAHCLFL